MKDAMGRGQQPEPAIVDGQAHGRKAWKRTQERCSICTNYTWLNSMPLMEPEGVPEPRRSWVLCNDCYQALVIEMRKSPIRSPLRLRIAMGIVAAERWPGSYSSSRTLISDRRWFLFIAWGFVIAMLFHLVLIVMIAMIAPR